MEDQTKKPLTTGAIMKENAQMKADMATVIAVVANTFKELGIPLNEIGQGKDVMQIMGKILPRLMTQMSTGGFNGDAFAQLNAIAPILARYEYLAPKTDE